ncbi:MAG: acyltransferase family protein [Anaerolineaceae bacterium]|nr:acyltransferase family protein [Anaerolineaceae bacterium]
MVVGIHTAMEGWYNISPRTYTWTILNFYDTLFRPAVPLFIMISGSLFLSKRQIDIKHLWLKNILHLAVIYLFWAVFYAITSTGIKKSLADPKIILDIVFGPNPQYHLWYLRTMINLYVISPLLWILVHGMDKKSFRYFLIIFIIFGLLRHTIYELPFTPSWLHEQINLFVKMDLIEYSGYFMLGFFLFKTDYIREYSGKKLISIYLVTLFLAAIINQLIAIAGDWPTQALYGNFSIPVAIEAFCLYKLIVSKVGYIHILKTHGKWLVRISESTLFVYLIHPFVIQRIHLYLNFYTTDYNVLFSVPFFVIIVFIISATLGMISKRIPILKNIC